MSVHIVKSRHYSSGQHNEQFLISKKSGGMVAKPVKRHIDSCNYFSHILLFSGCLFTRAAVTMTANDHSLALPVFAGTSCADIPCLTAVRQAGVLISLASTRSGATELGVSPQPLLTTDAKLFVRSAARRGSPAKPKFGSNMSVMAFESRRHKRPCGVSSRAENCLQQITLPKCIKETYFGLGL